MRTGTLEYINILVLLSAKQQETNRRIAIAQDKRPPVNQAEAYPRTAEEQGVGGIGLATN